MPRKERSCPAPQKRRDPEQIAMLHDRMSRMTDTDLRYGKLFDLLLQHGGEAVAAQPETDLEKIMARGYVADGRGARLVPGETSACHRNAALLWAEDRGRRMLVTGWALSGDGVWRQHSWVKDAPGRILETTEPREVYFGFDLEPEESVMFYLSNAGA